LYDSFGRNVKHIDFSGNQCLLNKDVLASGIYFVQILEGMFLLDTQKIIIE